MGTTEALEEPFGIICDYEALSREAARRFGTMISAGTIRLHDVHALPIKNARKRLVADYLLAVHLVRYTKALVKRVTARHPGLCVAMPPELRSWEVNEELGR